MNDSYDDARAEARRAALVISISQTLTDGEEAICKLSEIRDIVNDVVARIPTTDANVPWDALLEIRKVLR